MADDDHVACPPGRHRQYVLGLGSRSQALIGRRGALEGTGKRISGLTRPQEGARDHGHGLGSFVSQPLAEQPRGLMTLLCERAELVRLARRGLRVAYEVQAHLRENSARLRWLAKMAAWPPFATSSRTSSPTDR
jgi:hypothetical protein